MAPPAPTSRGAGSLAAPGLLRRIAPFAVAAHVGQLVATDHIGEATWAAWAGWAVALVVAGLMIATPWRRLPPFWQAAPALLYLVAVVFFRHASGGDASPVTVLLLLPVLWLTLYGSSREAAAAVAGVGAALLIPVFVWGDPAYHDHLGEPLVHLALAAATAYTGRRLIRAVHESEAGFRLMTETATDVVARVDSSGRFRYVSPSVRTVLGYEPEELVGRQTIDLAHPDDAGKVAASREALFGGAADAVEGEWRVRRRDGGHLWIETSVRAVRGRDGELLETHLSGRDISKRHDAEAERDRLLEELGRQAQEDPLTHLFNRRGWEQRVGAEWNRMQRSGRPLTLVVLDLDQFKAYNDRHGHAAGDELLRRTAESWRDELRRYDLLARLGGDEFALALPDSTPEDAVALVDRLRARIEQGVGCSAGVADARRATSLEVALLLADDALYAAKEAGRGRTVVAGGG